MTIKEIILNKIIFPIFLCVAIFLVLGFGTYVLMNADQKFQDKKILQSAASNEKLSMMVEEIETVKVKKPGAKLPSIKVNRKLTPTVDLEKTTDLEIAIRKRLNSTEGDEKYLIKFKKDGEYSIERVDLTNMAKEKIRFIYDSSNVSTEEK